MELSLNQKRQLNQDQMLISNVEAGRLTLADAIRRADAERTAAGVATSLQTGDR